MMFISDLKLHGTFFRAWNVSLKVLYHLLLDFKTGADLILLFKYIFFDGFIWLPVFYFLSIIE